LYIERNYRLRKNFAVLISIWKHSRSQVRSIHAMHTFICSIRNVYYIDICTHVRETERNFHWLNFDWTKERSEFGFGTGTRNGNGVCRLFSGVFFHVRWWVWIYVIRIDLFRSDPNNRLIYRREKDILNFWTDIIE